MAELVFVCVRLSAQPVSRRRFTWGQGWPSFNARGPHKSECSPQVSRRRFRRRCWGSLLLEEQLRAPCVWVWRLMGGAPSDTCRWTWILAGLETLTVQNALMLLSNHIYSKPLCLTLNHSIKGTAFQAVQPGYILQVQLLLSFRFLYTQAPLVYSSRCNSATIMMFNFSPQPAWQNAACWAVRWRKKKFNTAQPWLKYLSCDWNLIIHQIYGYPSSHLLLAYHTDITMLYCWCFCTQWSKCV